MINGLKQSMSTGTTYKICDLPEEYRPFITCIQTIPTNSYDSTCLGYLYINADNISIRTLKNLTDSPLYVMNTYICE